MKLKVSIWKSSYGKQILSLMKYKEKLPKNFTMNLMETILILFQEVTIICKFESLE